MEGDEIQIPEHLKDTAAAFESMTQQVLNASGVELSADTILTPREVADVFQVSIDTLSRWARQGKVRGFNTPGGHRRFTYANVLAAYLQAQEAEY